MTDAIGTQERPVMAKAVLRVLSGQSVETVSRALKVSAESLKDACERFVDAGAKAVSLETPRGLDRRNEIVWVAIRLFSERGFRSTRLEDISEALGMTRPALYYYYKNKDQLLVAAALEAMQDTARHGFALRVDPDADPVAELVARVEDRTRYLLGPGLPFHRMLLQERHELPQEATEAIAEDERAQVRGLADLIRRGIASGALADVPPTTAASTIMALIAGTARWFDPAKGRAEDIVQLVSRMVLKGISG